MSARKQAMSSPMVYGTLTLRLHAYYIMLSLILEYPCFP